MKWWKADSISNESILAGMKMANNGQTSWRWQRQRVYLKSLDKGAYEHGVNMDFSPPESWQINRLLNRLTAVCGMSVWTFTGSCHCVNATMFDRYGDADNPNGELPSYITGAENWKMHKTNSITGAGNIIMRERIHN